LNGRAVEYLASRRTNVLVAVSEDLAQGMRPWVSRRCQIELIVNGVDTDTFSPGRCADHWRERLSLDEKTPVIGIVSRLDPIKDFPTLLEALAIVRRNWTSGEPPVLVIAGDGPEREHIEQLTKQWNLQGAVHAIGWVGPTVDLYPLLDVFTLSSLSEGTSIALLEAMSSGICPVVTAVGGNPNVLGPGLATLLVPSGAAELLAERWRAVLSDPDARRGYAAAARQRVVECFSLSAMIAKYEALYERVHASAISDRGAVVHPPNR
jgi:glycosyltransferase involved in cell wall biosynthesis